MEKTKPLECLFCKGSGVYRGTQEPEGIGVVCERCDGDGKARAVGMSNGIPFVCLRFRSDVEMVYKRIGKMRGEYLGTPVTLAGFFNGKRPEGDKVTMVI